ncbi:MAG: hypothetical protein L0241_23230, partial [Planctomycetia bacterium]|nr:hypothetical protein [Planctomycetia bacterium]
MTRLFLFAALVCAVTFGQMPSAPTLHAADPKASESVSGNLLVGMKSSEHAVDHGGLDHGFTRFGEV